MKLFVSEVGTITLVALLLVQYEAQAQSYLGDLKLNNEQSILLPHFDTSSIDLENSSVSEVTLNLFLLEAKTSKKRLHVTVNPFDPDTNTIRDGVSTSIATQVNDYSSITLPVSLFKDVLGTNERFLIKLVDIDAQLTFAGSERAGIEMDPILNVVWKNDPRPPPSEFADLTRALSLENINNSDISIGDININYGQQTMSKLSPWNVLWAIITGIFTIIGGIYTYRQFHKK